MTASVHSSSTAEEAKHQQSRLLVRGDIGSRHLILPTPKATDSEDLIAWDGSSLIQIFDLAKQHRREDSLLE